MCWILNFAGDFIDAAEHCLVNGCLCFITANPAPVTGKGRQPEAAQPRIRDILIFCLSEIRTHHTGTLHSLSSESTSTRRLQ